MNLREILQDQNITIKRLSTLSKVSVRTIEDILRRDSCNIKTAIQLADALNVSLDTLCGRRTSAVDGRHTPRRVLSADSNYNIVTSKRESAVNTLYYMQDSLTTGDWFTITDADGRVFTMTIYKSYGYCDCISDELIGTTPLRSKGSDNIGGYTKNTVLIEYLNSYFENKFPPFLRPYVINKTMEFPVKLGKGSFDYGVEKLSIGPLWIPYSFECGVSSQHEMGILNRYMPLAGPHVIKTFNNYTDFWWTATPVHVNDRDNVAFDATGKIQLLDVSVKHVGVPLCFRLKKLPEVV